MEKVVEHQRSLIDELNKKIEHQRILLNRLYGENDRLRNEVQVYKMWYEDEPLPKEVEKMTALSSKRK